MGSALCQPGANEVKRPTFPIDQSLLERQKAAREKLMREGKQIKALFKRRG